MTSKCGYNKKVLYWGAGMAQGWHSGESTHLPQLWAGFDSVKLKIYKKISLQWL